MKYRQEKRKYQSTTGGYRHYSDPTGVTGPHNKGIWPCHCGEPDCTGMKVLDASDGEPVEVEVWVWVDPETGEEWWPPSEPDDLYDDVPLEDIIPESLKRVPRGG